MEEQIRLLRFLGLTLYQSKVMAALLLVNTATAIEISDLSQVPITRIYSILKELEDRGFLSSTITRPKIYKHAEINKVVDHILARKQEMISNLVKQREEIVSSLDALYR